MQWFGDALPNSLINNICIWSYEVDVNVRIFDGMDSIGIKKDDPFIPFNTIVTVVYLNYAPMYYLIRFLLFY